MNSASAVLACVLTGVGKGFAKVDNAAESARADIKAPETANTNAPIIIVGNK
ncbi:MAG: hypothetical protein IPP63_05930 [Chloracidobacterium sp.]|nr:hypothetical protein [Chloracidobacterium sp.]